MEDVFINVQGRDDEPGRVVDDVQERTVARDVDSVFTDLDLGGGAAAAILGVCSGEGRHCCDGKLRKD